MANSLRFPYSSGITPLATAHTYPSSACHCEPVRTLAWQSVTLCSGTWQIAALRANSQLFRIRREELLFGLCCRRSYGLPRRFAPRNDMQKLAACPHNTWALPVYCRKASLQPLTPGMFLRTLRAASLQPLTRVRLQHVIANHPLQPLTRHRLLPPMFLF